MNLTGQIRAGLKRGRGYVMGFTFIELLVAVSIFSVIAAGIYHTFHTGLRAWSAVNLTIMDNQRVRVFFKRITADLANTISYSSVPYKWGKDSVTFISGVDTAEGGGGDIRLVKIGYEMDKLNGQILRTLAPPAKDDDDRFVATEAALEGVKALSFEYCHARSDEHGGFSWAGDWEEGTEGFPRGIRITVTIQEASWNNPRVFRRIVFIPMGILGEG